MHFGALNNLTQPQRLPASLEKPSRAPDFRSAAAFYGLRWLLGKVDCSRPLQAEIFMLQKGHPIASQLLAARVGAMVYHSRRINRGQEVDISRGTMAVTLDASVAALWCP